MRPLAPPNPALPTVLSVAQARSAAHDHVMAAHRQWARQTASVHRCRPREEPKGLGPSGEAPLHPDAYLNDFVVELDVPREELRRRLQEWKR